LVKLFPRPKSANVINAKTDVMVSQTPYRSLPKYAKVIGTEMKLIPTETILINKLENPVLKILTNLLS
jgi:hypothetical protein